VLTWRDDCTALPFATDGDAAQQFILRKMWCWNTCSNASGAIHSCLNFNLNIHFFKTKLPGCDRIAPRSDHVNDAN
jgi:hypothetical protein